MIFKIIAMVSMLIDHIGFKYDIFIFRCIGRFALPIYAYYVVKHIFRYEDISKYLINMLFIALIAQLPYWLYFKIFQLNICFTWAICIVLLNFIKNRHKKITRILLSCIFAFFALTFSGFFEGCIFAWLWCLIWYFGIYEKDLENGQNDISFICAVFYVGSVLIFCILNDRAYWCLSLLSVPLMIIPFPDIRSKWVRYVYHWFYPGHLLLLCLL